MIKAMDLIALKNRIQMGERIKLGLYIFTESAQSIIYELVLELLSYYKKEDIFVAIHTAVFEAIMNAIKANAKKAFFEQSGLDMHKDIDYELGSKDFKNIIRSNQLDYYCLLAKEQGLFAHIIIEHSNRYVRFKIINNTPLLPQEEERIREKIDFGLKYDNVVDFYSQNADSSEGEGLGLVISLIMLKQEGIPVSEFRIGSKDGVTTARLEVAFSTKHITERKKYDLQIDRIGF